MLRSIYDQILNTIGKRMPECGGILGAGEKGIISEYYFDVTGKNEPDAYTPDVGAVNQVLEAWHERGIHMVGIVHSHKEGMIAPSCGDIRYGIRILKALDSVDTFYLPIITTTTNGVVIHPYIIDLNKPSNYICKKTCLAIVESDFI